MYYIRHKQTGLYFAGMRFENPYWRKKPRVYTTKGAAKLSMVRFLVNTQWSIAPEETKRRIVDNYQEEYKRKYPRSDPKYYGSEWAKQYVKHIYWNIVKNQPLEDLLPPDIELREITLQ